MIPTCGSGGWGAPNPPAQQLGLISKHTGLYRTSENDQETRVASGWGQVKMAAWLPGTLTSSQESASWFLLKEWAEKKKSGLEK